MPADHLANVSNQVELCAEVAAEAIVATAPELDRERIKRVMSDEIWMATTDIALAVTNGALV